MCFIEYIIENQNRIISKLMELREGKNHHFYEKLKSNKLNQNEFKNTPFFSIVKTITINEQTLFP